MIAKVIQTLPQTFCKLFICSIQNNVTFYATACSKMHNMYYIDNAIVALKTP